MFQLLVVVSLGFVFSACSTTHYLFQAAQGQLAMINRAKPIREALKNPRTPSRVTRLLEDVPNIKNFGEKRGLKATRNYEEYVQLDRPFANYVVSACKPFAFEPKTWNFPVVGSFTYLGWFDLEEAKAYARNLEKEGWEVDVRGAAAYSTLGWFRDPVVSSMIPEGATALGGLANVVLHESVHATFYIPGQSSFNESVASFVADHLTREYLAEKFAATDLERKVYEEREKEGERRGAMFARAYEELEALYRSRIEPEAMKEKKQKIYDQLRASLKTDKVINNATLIQYRTYGLGEVEFQAVFESCGRDWSRFWGQVRAIAKKSFPRPQDEKFGEVVLKVKCG